MSSLPVTDALFNACTSDVDALYERCFTANPNYQVGRDEFATSIRAAVDKYLASQSTALTRAEVLQFLNELQSADLFLAIACAKGNERAWWDFDAGYRRYIERIARHLASAETQADEVIDLVYTELYGTRLVEGVRQSKFTTYMGRGSLRGWLRVIVWHAVVDAHRAGHDEISIEDWSESGGETDARPGWTPSVHQGEREMIDAIARERYKKLASEALDYSFAALENHEKLLLLYYHVEGMKLREIARLVEDTGSPLRHWFQRQSKRRAELPSSRVHESTVMRWLEKLYEKVLNLFRERLSGQETLSAEEVNLCVELAAEGFLSDRLSQRLMQKSSET